MRMIDVISHKRDKKVLSTEEIRYWITGVSDHSIPDYQSSSLLMAIVLNGMNDEETAALCDAMMNSGDVIDLSAISRVKCDKHSTGGVGDKTSIVLGPLVASCGVKIAKMSGRGLGHTGGTLDKLEAIPGFHIELSEQQFIDQVNDIGIGIIGQSGNLVPADKELYALRDVTATVSSIPLIASSIMSKKLAAGSDCILLDVKFGDGAFMQTLDEARSLAKVMIAIGQKMGRKVNAMLTNMNQPLGNAIGNACEIKEAVLTLKGQGPKDFSELCLQGAALMLVQAGVTANTAEGYILAEQQINNGQAYEKFLQWIQAQGGDISVFDDLDTFTKARYSRDVNSPKSGYIHDLKAMQLGLCGMHLGAGRKTKEDTIDYRSGLLLHKKTGDKILAGECLVTLYSEHPITEEIIYDCLDSFVISGVEVQSSLLIADVL